MPSNKILEEKKLVVESLAAKMQSAKAGVLVKYEGIKVSEDTELRAALRKAGVEYSVMKNTLTGRACDIAGYGDMKQYLSGMTAIAIGTTDPVAPAKVLKEYAEKIESFQILAGYLDGAVVDADTVNKLADIPSKEVLIAKLLGSIKSPIYGFAYALQAVIDRDGEAAPAAAEEAAEA
jgi:large subunit ribosomal protein L10